MVINNLSRPIEVLHVLQKSEWFLFTLALEESELHGIKQISRSSNGMIRRVIWSLLYLTSLGVLASTTIRQLVVYCNYDHVTKFDVQYVDALDFPTVTICNVNKHRRSALTLQDIMVMGPHLEITDENLTLLNPEFYPDDWYNSVFVNRNWSVVQEAYSHDDFDVADFYNRTGHQLDDLVQYCTWRNEMCNKSDWSTVYTHYGKCYSFNAKGLRHSTKAGTGNALELILNIERDEYLEDHHSDDMGIKFLAHHPTEPPFLQELGYGLAPSSHYLVALQERKISALPDPYGSCAESQTLKFFPNYSISGCRIECELDIIYKECACRLVESPGDYPICTVEQSECAHEVHEVVEHTDACVCQNPCQSVKYPFTLSMTYLRETSIKRIKSQRNVSSSLTRDQLLTVSIYYDVLASEEISQTPAYSLLDIVSDFGGNSGLWIGASVLAAAQLVDFILTKFYTRVTDGWSRNTVGASATRVKRIHLNNL